MNNDQQLDEFLKTFEAIAERSPRNYAYRKPMSLSEYNVHYSALDIYEYESYIERQQMVALHIPQHRFNDLLKMYDHYNRMEETNNRAVRIIAQQTNDSVVRESNPSVKRAYENYKMLLELARS